jgi:hypothetical protein
VKTQGLQYVLVFLELPTAAKLPVTLEADALPRDKEGQPMELVQIGSPKGQFHPRVVSLHPRQRLEIINNSDPPVSCDAHLGGPKAYSRIFKPGEKQIFDLEPSNREPYHVRGGVYTWKDGHVWRMAHPYTALTNAEGMFEIKHVPVLEGEHKLVLWVWHEMLPGLRFREIGPIELSSGEILTKDLTLPE